MSRSFTVVSIGIVLSLHAAAAATVAVATDALDAGIVEESRLGGALTPESGQSVTSVRVVAPPSAPERVLSANPLWGIPLTQLSGTRDRPIFSPSRRPPPAVVVAVSAPAPAPPPRKRQVQPPPLSLVGTIASDEESFGIFLDQSTKQALRLKVGEDYQGWKLRAVHGREATMEKDQQVAVLNLPAPGQPSGGDVRLLPVNASDAPLPIARNR
jgi:general secretion pathway protein N